MTFDPGITSSHARFTGAFQYSRRKMQPFRAARTRAVKAYAGSNYGDDGGGNRVVANMIELAVNVYTHALSASITNCSVTTKVMEWKSTAYALELALEYFNKNMGFSEAMARCIFDAQFAMGIAKIGLDTTSTIRLYGEDLPVIKPFIDVVDFDDFVIDMAATSASGATFLGNRYRVPLRNAKKIAEINKSSLVSTPRSVLNDSGDFRQESTGGDDSSSEEIEDCIDLWDIWFPDIRTMVTYPAPQGGEIGRPIRIVEDWYGPECGPFLTLGFYNVPKNVLPLAPVSNLIDLGLVVNKMFVKVARQGERQKRITGVMSGGQKEAQTVISAQDGEVVRLDNPDKVKEFAVGGVDQAVFGSAVQLKQLFSYIGGNLDSMGGLAAQSDTMGQEQLIKQSSSARLNFMSGKTGEFITKCEKAIAWYMFYDPNIDIPIVKKIPGSNYEIQSRLTQEMIQGEFLDYNFDISPYAGGAKTPQEKLNILMKLWMETIMPAAEMMGQFGITPDFEGYLKLFARYTDMSELEEIVQFSAPQQPPEQAVSRGGSSAPKPKNSTRVYERVHNNRQTQAGQEQVLANTLLGGNPQQSEVAKAMAGPQ